VITFTF